MICILALIVFSILGIFSAAYRKLAKEAFSCVFLKVTLRKCESGLDVRLKSKITGKLMRKNKSLAKAVYKHFEVISWAFVILFLVSTVYVGIGGYNYYMYGNCNGPVDTGFCVFDPFGHNSQVSEDSSCNGDENFIKDLSYNNIDVSMFPKIGTSSTNEILFIGCYSCAYTREVYPEIKDLINKDVSFYFAHFPINHADNNVTKITNCAYYYDKNKFVDLIDGIFESDIEKVNDFDYVLNLATDIGYNVDELNTCIASEGSQELYDKQIAELKKTNVYGTPTIFVNEEPVVGPKPLRVYERLLK